MSIGFMFGQANIVSCQM